MAREKLDSSKEISEKDDSQEVSPRVTAEEVIDEPEETMGGFVVAGGFRNNTQQLADRIIVEPASSRPNNEILRLDVDLNNPSGFGGTIFHRLITFTSGDATPSVKNATLCITAGTTAITDFDDGEVGQIIYIKATANITITDGAPIILNGSADYTMTDTDTLTLAMFDDQVWQEISRSVN